MLNRVTRIPVALVGLTLLIPSVQAQQTQLPSEGTIPGQAKQAAGAKRSDLPSEATLPGQLAPPDVAASNLASEATLPPVRNAEGQTDPLRDPRVIVPAGDDLQEREPADRPWLRLTAAGPSGPLRSIAFSPDSQRLLAGGQDKALHVWQHREKAPAAQSTWVYEKAVYWQVQRAQRGAILSVAPSSRVIAFGGVGASASLGELALVDAQTLLFSRALFDLQEGHRTTLQSVAALDDGTALASLDAEGRVIRWIQNAQTGRWELTTLRRGDYDLFDQASADSLFQWRSRGGAIALAGNRAVFYPELASEVAVSQPPRWHLMRAAAGGNPTRLSARVTHGGAVTAVACSSDGSHIASADLTDQGRIFLWDLNSALEAENIQAGAPVRALALSNDGQSMVVGTARARDQSPEVQLWSRSAENSWTLRATWNESVDVLSCCLSPDQQWLAYVQDSTVIVRSLGDLAGTPTILGAELSQPDAVAFSADQDSYMLGLLEGTLSREAGARWAFDPRQLRLEKLVEDDSTKWIEANPYPDRWTLVPSQQSPVTWSVHVDGESICQIPLEGDRDGQITCASWIPDADNPLRPEAIIVGTAGRNHVYLFRIGRDACELIRQYRGHSSVVSSVGYSADHKYLVSGSRDHTARIWKIDQSVARQGEQSSMVNKWGATFGILDGKLTVSSIVEDGPLYFRGVRQGDSLERVAWVDSAVDAAVTEPESADSATILERLQSANSHALYRFHFSRGAVQRPYFYLYPAWQPLASFVWTPDREWAYWTPYGYYDASFNGHRMFGWQVNRGIDREPDFFRAAELKEELERPQLLGDLLVAGDVHGAFQLTRTQTPGNLSDRLGAANRLRPAVTIVQPIAGATIIGNQTVVRARVELPEGVDLITPRAFANGVPARQARLVSEKAVDGRRHLDFQWEADLPADRRLKIQVLTSSNLGHGAMAEVLVDHTPADQTRQPKLFLLAAGVNDYSDSRIPSLDFAVNNALAIRGILEGSVRKLDDHAALVLTNESLSPSLWRATTTTMLDQIEGAAHPDDLLVIFLSGHGFRDEQSDRYFYLTPLTRYDEVLGRRYHECISFEDLSAFAKVPCRKLIILDTCHSGAVQSLRQQDLKSVVRALENDLVFTLTASEGAQAAFESPQRQLGVFTARLIDGLTGSADAQSEGGNADSFVTLDELVRFVKQSVPGDAARSGLYQFPTASPADLIDLAEIPLTISDGQQR